MRLTRTSTTTFESIEVRGKPEFLRRTEQALAVLTSASQFKVIQTNLAVIRQGRRSGIKAWAVKPTFTVGKATWRHSVVWYAGAIAHDAYHAKLYIDAKGRDHGKKPDNDA